MICRVCKIEKSLEDFPWAKRNQRRSSRCKECQKILSKNHYQNNPRPYKERDAVRRQEYKNKILPLLYQYLIENPCVVCGESEPIFLDFDHIISEEKFSTISSMVAGKTSWEGILKEIKKCQVLCVKCHRLKTGKDYNWYQYQKYVEKHGDVV